MLDTIGQGSNAVSAASEKAAAAKKDKKTTDAATAEAEVKKAEKKPRRSAKEIAQDALDVAERKLTRAEERKREALETMRTIGAEIARLTAERDYAAQHPALKVEVTEEYLGEPMPVVAEGTAADAFSTDDDPDEGAQIVAADAAVDGYSPADADHAEVTAAAIADAEATA